MNYLDGENLELLNCLHLGLVSLERCLKNGTRRTLLVQTLRQSSLVSFEKVFPRLAFYFLRMFVRLQAPRVASHATVEGHKPPGELEAQPTRQLHQE